MEGKEGAGDPPELVARRLVGLVNDGGWSRGRAEFRLGFGLECGFSDVMEEESVCRRAWALDEVRLVRWSIAPKVGRACT